MDALAPSSPKSTSSASSAQPLPSPREHSGSPRFQAFSRHFRRSKSPSTHSIPEEQSPKPIHHPLSASAKAEAVREAKRFLAEVIRDDWTYPEPTPAATQDTEPREPLSYRYREDGPSDIDHDSDEGQARLSNSNKSAVNPYRFESPDAIGTSIRDRRRRKRRRVVEEMKWNPGLRNWINQRDAWTCATHTPRLHHTSSINPRPSSDSTDLSISSRASLPSHQSTTSSPSPEPGLTTPPSSPLLPIFPPLLPASNPVRSSIAPALYPILYSKIVIQSLTPTVPIPLPDMVNALMHGWKAEGNWPPKPSTVDQGTGKKSTRFRRDGVKRGLRRALGHMHHHHNHHAGHGAGGEEMPLDGAEVRARMGMVFDADAAHLDPAVVTEAMVRSGAVDAFGHDVTRRFGHGEARMDLDLDREGTAGHDDSSEPFRVS